MAIANLQKSFQKSLSKAAAKYNNYASSLKANTLVEFDFAINPLIDSCWKGTDLVAEELPEEEAIAMREANSKTVWKKLVNIRLNEILNTRKWGGQRIMATGSKAKTPVNGVYFKQRQQSITTEFGLIIWCRKPSDANKIVDSGVRKLLEDLWEDFQTESFGAAGDPQLRLWGVHVGGGVASQSRKGNPMTVQEKFRGGIRKEHHRETTKAKFAIEKNYKDIKLAYKGKMHITSLDPVKFIKDNLIADWNQLAKKREYANFNVKNVLTLRLGLNVPLEATDVPDLVSFIKPYLYAEITKAERQYGNVLTSVEMKASHPIADQIRDDVIKDIAKPFTDKRLAANRPRTKSGAFDMRFKANRGLKNLKNFKPINRKETLGGGGGTKAVKRRIKVISIRGRNRKQRKESGQGQQASTSQAAELARLKREINKNLSAEVRRNMGKPALSYRTGRFANSVQVLNLMEARNTVIAKYTYLLRPYQTFENQGKYRWPMSYNPKTLIAKSIRNLAQGRIEQKLTVRRV